LLASSKSGDSLPSQRSAAWPLMTTLVIGWLTEVVSEI
jgi:hypothetical protein